jgi:heptosyltransferase-2/heptosyltransferase-3
MTSRPLIVRIGALGDMVLMTVAIRVLQKRFGSLVDVLGSGGWTRPLLQGQPGVGQIYLLASRKRPFYLSPNQWALLSDLKRRGAGPTWLFDSHNHKTRGLLLRAGWSPAQFAELSQLADIRDEHFCDRWQRFALLDPPALGARAHPATPPAYPQLQVSDEQTTAACAWLQRLGIADRPCVLVQVGNKRTMRVGAVRRASNTKYWPEERWAQLLQGLHALHPDCALLLLGVRREAALNERILALARVPAAYNLASEMTVPRLMALAQRALGMVSVDTGPAHVAAALGGRVLTLFDSLEKQLMYAPRGPGARVRCLVAPAGTRALLGISVAEVLQAWQSLLALQPLERAASA